MSKDRSNERICVVIPAYKEEKRIGEVVEQVLKHVKDVIVVDDGSGDGTAENAKKAGAIVVEHEQNKGKGVALNTGISAARELGFDVLIVMDADGQHSPEDLPNFVEAYARTGIPVLIGNRMCDVSDMPLHRKWTNQFMSWLISREMRQYVPDTQCGYRLYRADIMPFVMTESTGYAAESEILLHIAEQGIRVDSVPARTIYGDEQSKINPLRDTIRFFSMLHKYRMKKHAMAGGGMTPFAAVKTFIHGCVVGVANIIPGVSGGTMALILGFYERLIGALNNINVQTILTGLKLLTFNKKAIEGFKSEWKRVDATFLSILFGGSIVAIFALSSKMKVLLIDFHDPTYAFFFGLIIASVIVPYKYLKRKSFREVIAVAIAVVLVLGVSGGVSDQKKIAKAESKLAREEAKLVDESLEEDAGGLSALVSLEVPPVADMAIMFGAAMIAISAMILPGISGSFLLLLMNQYFRFITAISDREIFMLAVFGLGCVVGLLVFVRLMNWLLKRFYNPTLAFMIGLMIGSLWTIWPFKTVAMVGHKAVYLGNIMPSALSPNEINSICAAVVGAAIVLIFCWLDSKVEEAK